MSISQEEANRLIEMKKILDNDKIKTFKFPAGGEKLNIHAKCINDEEDFIFDICRGRIDLKKVTYQNRYQKTNILMRLDITKNGFHYNPDGTKISGSHLHIYDEEHGNIAKAYPVSINGSNFTNSLANILFDFFHLCNVINIPNYQGRLD